jgi:uncharacterized protein (TIGR03067 family)
LALGVGLLFAVTAPLSAGDARDEAVKKDRQRYERTWQVVSLEVNGNQSADEDARKSTVVNEADGTWAIEVGGKVVARGTSEIDPTKKPRAVDFTVTEGDNSGKAARGIYEFKDDTRTVCLVQPGGERPHPGRPQAGEEVREARRDAADWTSCCRRSPTVLWFRCSRRCLAPGPSFQLHAGTAQRILPPGRRGGNARRPPHLDIRVPRPGTILTRVPNPLSSASVYDLRTPHGDVYSSGRPGHRRGTFFPQRRLAAGSPRRQACPGRADVCGGD